MTVGQEDSKPIDPFEASRAVRDAYLDAMSKVMIKAVNSEEYAQATGALLDGCLTLSAPLRDALDKAMVLALGQLSMPSRQQIAALAERFTNVETRLDDMDAKLDLIVELSSATRPPATVDAPAAKRAAASGKKSPKRASARKVSSQI